MRTSTLLLALLAIPAASPAAAQQGTAARPDSASRDSARVAPTLTRVIVRDRATRHDYGTTRSRSATKTDTPLLDTPQSVTVVSRELIADQAMQGMADVVRYVPGIGMAQGEGHRDAPVIRGNTTTADFFVDGVRDDAQYLRDLYNAERVEALKGSNALAFGRGGGGGVINRVSKQAGWSPSNSFTYEGGSFAHRRGTLDVGSAATTTATRLTAMYEKSAGFRDATDMRRFGLNTTLAAIVDEATMVRASYELFDDARTVDRGIPSFQGEPAPAPVTTFFGDPGVSRSTLRAQVGGVSLERQLPWGMQFTNRTRYTRSDKFYQNIYPGAVVADGSTVELHGYNSAIGRTNLFNQTDLTAQATTGGIAHVLLAGAELAQQETESFRNTAYFANGTTTASVTFDHPTVSIPVTFRQSASDADNSARASVAAAYVQDQVTLSPAWQAIAAVRYDVFGVRFFNNRNAEQLARTDRMVSPRVGLVFKPVGEASVYASVSRTSLPSSGDQFSSLTVTTQALEPEQFVNRELGAKWDVTPALSLSAAGYQLDRSNSAAPDPTDPSKTVQTGRQRTSGVELGATGAVTPRWQLAGGLARQRATIVAATKAAGAGARVPLVPDLTASLWNRYQATRSVGVGLGVIHQGESFAAIDNTVRLPHFTRFDGALFLSLPQRLTAQLNVENVLDTRYYPTSQGNNNIMPGAVRTVRVSVVRGFRGRFFGLRFFGFRPASGRQQWLG